MGVPPETLRSRIATPGGKARYVKALFHTIAPRYDLITRLLSYGQDQRWKMRLIDLADIVPGERVLDVACGTGDLAYAALTEGGSVLGVDLTHAMLTRAYAKDARGGVRFAAGDMLALPCPDSTFSVVTVGYGLRNVPDLAGGLTEIHRVLRPGGRLLSLDFNRPESATLRRAYLAYLQVVGALLGWVLHRDPDTYRYIPESLRLYPGAHGVAALMREAGFDRVDVHPLLGGLMAIHVARRPTASAHRSEPSR